MNLGFNGLKGYFSKNIFIYLVILFIVLALLEFLAVLPAINTWFQLFLVAVFLLMATGQILLAMPFGHVIVYYSYLTSILVGTNISLYIWFGLKGAFSTFSLLALIGVWALLVAIFGVVHFRTFRKEINWRMTPIFSFILFGIIFVFANPQGYSALTYDSLFFLTIAIFIVNGVICSNQLLRASILNKELGLVNREKFIIETRERLLKISNVQEKDIDLFVYYLKSSINAFILGEFGQSFMDVFKIGFDNHGKSFENIYKLPENKKRQQHFTDIRDCLSHAKHTPKDEEEKEKEKLKRLNDVKRVLYFETLELLKITKKEYIVGAVKKVEN